MQTSKKNKVRDKLFGHCGYCGSKENITVDHIKPIKLDGDHNNGNLMPCCYACNQFKGSMKLKQFRHALKKKKHWKSTWPNIRLDHLENYYSDFSGKFFYQQYDKIIDLRNHNYYRKKAEYELLDMATPCQPDTK